MFSINVLCFYSSSKSSPAQKISAIRCIHESLRFFLTTQRKNVFPATMKPSMALNDYFTHLLDNEQLPMETLFNCSLSIVYFYMADESITSLQCWMVKLTYLICMKK